MRYHDSRESALAAMRTKSSVYVVPEAARGLERVRGWHWNSTAKIGGRDVVLLIHAARMREHVAYLDSL